LARCAGEDADGTAEWNLANRSVGSIKYGQSQLDISDEMDLTPTGRAIPDASATCD
jgi:hypothetical protein